MSLQKRIQRFHQAASSAVKKELQDSVSGTNRRTRCTAASIPLQAYKATRCDNAALVDEHHEEIVDDKRSPVSNELEEFRNSKSKQEVDGYELSIRVLGLDDDDVSELHDSEDMLDYLAEDVDFEVEFDEITVNDDEELQHVENDDLDSGASSSVWDGKHDIFM